jgi:hypothetical protein
MGTTLSVNIFLASDPVFDNMPKRESREVVAACTSSDEDINEKPERLFLR